MRTPGQAHLGCDLQHGAARQRAGKQRRCVALQPRQRRRPQLPSLGLQGHGPAAATAGARRRGWVVAGQQQVAVAGAGRGGLQAQQAHQALQEGGQVQVPACTDGGAQQLAKLWSTCGAHTQAMQCIPPTGLAIVWYTWPPTLRPPPLPAPPEGRRRPRPAGTAPPPGGPAPAEQRVAARSRPAAARPRSRPRTGRQRRWAPCWRPAGRCRRLALPAMLAAPGTRCCRCCCPQRAGLRAKQASVPLLRLQLPPAVLPALPPRLLSA